MNTLKKILLTLTFSTLGVAFTSNATPITSWDWEVDTAFTDYDPAADINASDTNTWWGDPTFLSWGTEANIFDEISSLDVSSGSSGNKSGTGLASGDWALTATLTHNNFIITGNSLSSAQLSTKLQIAPNGMSLDDGLPALMFDILFEETPNAAPCTYGGIIPCSNDIFVIDLFGAGGDDIVFDPITGSFNQQFSIGQYTYNIAILVDTLAELHPDICARAGVQGGASCIGLTTVENQENAFDVNMRITQVPEPASILLLSLALLGIFASMRNKHI